MNYSALAPVAAALFLIAIPGRSLGADAPPPFRIGILTDESGTYAENGGTGNVVAARLAIADYGGKVLGRPIELRDADHKNDPAVGSAILRDWFDNAGVDVVAGLSTSSVALAAQEIGRARGKTLLIAGAPDSDLTGKACAATSSHWAEDTYALARSTTEAVVQSGGDSWFFLTVDYAFGQAMERDAVEVVKNQGALVLGQIRHPLGTTDFASYLDAARKSRAKVIALADAGADAVNAIKQADAAHLGAGGQSLAGLLIYITDVNAIGLAAAQRLYVTEGFYWDQNDQARAFAKRFNAEAHHMPTKQQAATYASISHYLKAADAVGTIDAGPVNAKMRELPVDFFGRAGSIRADGQVVYDLTLYQVKSPAESQYPWDFYKKVRDIPAARAFRPVEEGGCPLVKR
ncbi:MAG TPA: ABC transporter substrate-binding protein [Aliidongia sp.]|uniref:ABC transporter substrate-binding protein n=1 Tax=Aliidongia sp. TaxID=1914230 RepID=UPI002DDCDCAB|nr:ABC transporter substrate-binding protein [Aliidongia sp.]HEV2673555.1 ABC transporter substrate-binding protein [Aliidongia sp.]